MKNIMPARFWKRNIRLRVQGCSLRSVIFRDPQPEPQKFQSIYILLGQTCVKNINSLKTGIYKSMSRQ